MDFGAALKKMKSGKAVTRLGWNGKGQKVWIEKGIADFEQFRGIPPMLLSGVPIDLFNKGLPLVVTTFPCLSMLTTKGDIVRGWLASQTDMLAEDWFEA